MAGSALTPIAPPRLSLILPLIAGKKAWAERSVERLLAARFSGLPKIEILALDDGTREEIGEYLKQIFSEAVRSEELRIIPLDRTGDLGKIKNTGATMAQGKILAFLHPDELWRANDLARAVQGMRDRSVRWSFQKTDILEGVTPLEALALKRLPLWKGSLLVDRALWDETGRLPEGYTGFPLPTTLPGEAVREWLIRALAADGHQAALLSSDAIEEWHAPGPPPIPEILLPLKKMEPFLNGISVLKASRSIPLKTWGTWTGQFAERYLREVAQPQARKLLTQLSDRISRTLKKRVP